MADKCKHEFELTDSYEDATLVVEMWVYDEVNVFTCKKCGQKKEEYA